MTPEEKDYQFYLLAKELKVVKWNSTLDDAINVLKKNSLQNNTHIEQQKLIIDELNQHLAAADDNTKALRESLKAFKNETKKTLVEVSKEKGVKELLQKGEINPFHEVVIKLSQHITVILLFNMV